MKYRVIIAQSAQAAFKKLDGRWRSRLKREMRDRLVRQPKKESKSGIKRLRGLRRPQYRMRVDEMRIFYDVNDGLHRVEVLGFVKKPDTRELAEATRGAGMTTHTMTEAKNDICSIIREAEKTEVLITRHGKPAAIIIGFQDDDDWLDYRLEHDEKFLRKIAKAREEIKKGQFVTLDELPD